MAFLDDLKKEAEALKEHELGLTQARMMEVTQSFLLVQSKLKMILLYLQELAKNLNMHPVSPVKTYYIDGFGTIDDYRPEKYVVNAERISIDQREFIKIILLRFVCKTEREIVIEKNIPSMIEMQRQYLWQANLKFQCTEFKNAKGRVDRASFTLVKEIPVHIKFAADFEQARIFLSMKNFNGLTVNEFTYGADEVNENLLDEFAKYLVGKPCTFMELGRHQQALKQKVAARRVSAEPAYARPDPKLDAQAEGSTKERKKGLLGSLKSLLSKE